MLRFELLGRAQVKTASNPQSLQLTKLKTRIKFLHTFPQFPTITNVVLGKSGTLIHNKMHPNTDFRRLGNMLTKVRLLVLDEFVGYLDELTPLALVRNVIKNYAQLEAREKVRVVKAEEVGELYGGMFANAKYNDMTGVLLNESSGWAEAGEVLESVIGTAIASGVKFVEADITTLLFDEIGRAHV